MADQSSTTHYMKGIVKQVLSGDCVVIRGTPKGGPPPERILALSNITAPRLARRGNPNSDTSTESKDEPYAWDSREYLRKLLVGKEVFFNKEYTTSQSREYGTVLVNRGSERVNVAELMVSEGLVEVRQNNSRQPSEELSTLIRLEADAKAQNKGKWGKLPPSKTVRDITWTIDNLRQFVDKNLGKQLDVVVEHVRDGCTFRVITVKSFQVFMVAMTGIKCPTFRRENDKEVPEPLAEQAKFFTESRLLQRDIKISIEGLSNQNVVLATVIHPSGNIAELLLKEGFAWCVDWSMAMVAKDKDKLRAAEKHAKDCKLRHWKDYQPSSGAIATSALLTKNFHAKVVEVVNADALVVKTDKGTYQKIFFSSLRPPKRPEESTESAGSNVRSRMLYDIPYMFEAREFLRKKLIGKRVQVAVDYVKPAQDQFQEKVCCTVTRDGINLAEALISKGLAYCTRHGRNDDLRSSCFDDLLTAENRAEKNKKGVHSRKDSTLRVADVSGDTVKARQFLPFLQRAGRTTALVEFVMSGSKVKLYLPKDTCLITLILAGVSCPRAATFSGSDKQNKAPAEPYGQEAMMFTKELIMQREVDVEVENCDKGGNFIGWLFQDNKNLAISLVEEGYCKVLPQAERSQYARQLLAAEETARSNKKRVWENYVEPTEDENGDINEGGEESTGVSDKEDKGMVNGEPTDRKVDYRKVIVTEIDSCNHFWAQSADKGPSFETLMQQLRADLQATPPLTGSYTPRKGVMCVAKFSDGLWYRAQIEKIASQKEVHVLYIDYGNKGVVSSTDIAQIPSKYSSHPPLAKEYFLAYVQEPSSDDEWKQAAMDRFAAEVSSGPVMLNVEYKVQGQDFVTLVTDDQEERDIGYNLVKEGFASVVKRKDKRLKSLVSRYTSAEQEAYKCHRNIWQYGDFRADDAKEFGYQK